MVQIVHCNLPTLGQQTLGHSNSVDPRGLQLQQVRYSFGAVFGQAYDRACKKDDLELWQKSSLSQVRIMNPTKPYSFQTFGSPQADPYPNFEPLPYIYIYIYYKFKSLYLVVVQQSQILSYPLHFSSVSLSIDNFFLHITQPTHV